MHLPPDTHRQRLEVLLLSLERARGSRATAIISSLERSLAELTESLQSEIDDIRRAKELDAKREADRVSMSSMDRINLDSDLEHARLLLGPDPDEAE